MKKILLLLIILFSSTYGFSQTTSKSYKTPVKSSQTTAKSSLTSVKSPQTPAVSSPVPVVLPQTSAVPSQAPAVSSPVPVVLPQAPAVSSQATDSFSKTTEEEYSYITKELKVQIDGNFDMKKGYELKTLKVINSYQKRAELGQLIRTSDKSIACYWIKFTNFKTYYFCLPNPHSTTEIINKCDTDLKLGMNTHSMSMFIISMLSGLEWQAK